MHTTYKGRKKKQKSDEKEVRRPNNEDGNEYTYDEETFNTFDDLRGLWEVSEMRLDPHQNNNPKYRDQFLDPTKWKMAKKYRQKPYVYNDLCICGREIGIGTDVWIQCDFCQRWYHAACVGLADSQAETLETFKCTFCKTNVDKAREAALYAMKNVNPSQLCNTGSIIVSGKRKRQCASWRERLISIGIEAAKTELIGPETSAARKVSEDAYILMQSEQKDI